MATANLSFYGNERDLQGIIRWLIDQREVSFILSTGDKTWKAFDRLELPQVAGRKIRLWHVPSGPLPLLKPGESSETPSQFISDPTEGWTELRTGADPSIPWFGAIPPNVFAMQLAPTSERIPVPDAARRFKLIPAPPGTRVIGRSDFEYPGMKELDRSKTALSFWNRLTKHLFGLAICVDALGWVSPDKNPTPESVKKNTDYVALPDALAEMRHGTPWMPYPD